MSDFTTPPDEEDMDRVRDFSRRLIRRPCLWKNCHAVLDSGEKLLKHVKIVHGTQIENKLYTCQWKECPNKRGFTDSERLIRHLQWHVNTRIYCGYKECGFQTQLPVQLTEHVAEHIDGEQLRPYAVPFDLDQPDTPALVDDTFPAYMSIPIPVSPFPISRDRHQKIGPWVLHRIFGKVAIKKGAVSAAVPLRSQRLLEKQVQPAETYDMHEMVQQQFNPQDDYDFLKKEGVTKSFATLAPLPLLIDDIEVAGETVLDTDNAEPFIPETSLVGDSGNLQGPAVPDVVIREGGLDLPPANAGGVMAEKVVVSPAQDADEVEELL